MHYPVWIHCCKWPNYDFCISQGSVATVLKWGGQNYGHLHQVQSWCCMPKINKIGWCFTKLLKNKSGTIWWTRVYIHIWPIRTCPKYRPYIQLVHNAHGALASKTKHHHIGSNCLDLMLPKHERCSSSCCCCCRHSWKLKRMPWKLSWKMQSFRSWNLMIKLPKKLRKPGNLTKN